MNPDVLVFAIEALSDLGMPAEEMDTIVGADQRVIVHRLIELHRERLEERLADQVRTLERLEEILSQEILEAASRRPNPHGFRLGAGSPRDPRVVEEPVDEPARIP